MAVLRRARGALLRLVRRRRLAVMIGVLLIVPAAWIQVTGRPDAWWAQGLSLIAGASGLALAWTGITGVAPDWIDE